MKERRVVVTGLGALTPIGNDVDTFWNAALNGENGVQPITKFDTKFFKTKFAAELKNYTPSHWLTRQEIRRNDPYVQYALYTASEAIADSEIQKGKYDPYRMGVIWGSGQGGLTTMEQEVLAHAQGGGTPRFSPFLIPKYIANMSAGAISIKFGLQGISYSTTSACASANTAIMEAFNYIKWNKADAFVIGASDSPISEASIGGFNSLKALSTDNDNYRNASRPFDQSRNGFVVGEGAGCLVLEEYEHAIARGAKIYCEIKGAAMTSDAHHITASDPEGKSASRAMELAIRESGLEKSDIHYLNAHATSTPQGDLAEFNAIRKVFRDYKNTLSIGGTKSMTGHLLGAAGAIEAVLCIKSIENNHVPPTINTEDLGEEMKNGWDFCLGNKGKPKAVYAAMNNSFGFGGHNSVVIFSKVD